MTDDPEHPVEGITADQIPDMVATFFSQFKGRLIGTPLPPPESFETALPPSGTPK